MLINENGVWSHLFIVIMNIFLWLLIIVLFIGLIGLTITCIKDGIKGRHTTIEIEMNDKEKRK